MTAPMDIKEAAKPRPYTTNDIAVIRAHYLSHGAGAVAKMLGRTVQSVRKTAHHHGIRGKRGRRADV